MLYETDPVLAKLMRDVRRQADGYANAAPLVYEKQGPRLLPISRECLKRIYALALAYHWTGEPSYAQEAVENMLAVCVFPDWNPLHFLDVAEMTHAVGIGYDWLYEYMDEQTRETIRSGLIKHGLEPGLKAYKAHWFVRSERNWNQVCKWTSSW